jgi:hypothetical protein
MHLINIGRFLGPWYLEFEILYTLYFHATIGGIVL